MAISKYEFYLRLDNLLPEETEDGNKIATADLILPTRPIGEPKDGSQEVRQVTKAEFTAWVNTQPAIDDPVHNSHKGNIVKGTEWVKEYTVSRVGEYPDVKDQLDGIYKALKAISASGISFGADADAYIASVDKVKVDFPKV
jgi:hypothetical protein